MAQRESLMAKAKASGRMSTHDRKVREIVRALEGQGYRVRADVRGRERPSSVGTNRFVPDIDAVRDGHRLIVEVETPSDYEKDTEQLKAVATYARQRPDTTFRLVVTRPRKRRTAQHAAA